MGFNQQNGGFNGIYPAWLCQQSAIEHGPVEIVSFPMNSMVDLSIQFCKRLEGKYV